MNIFSTHILNKVVENLDVSYSFLLDSFFNQVQTEQSERIYFDIEKTTRRLSPFVSPLVAGQVVDAEGYETKSFQPAYVKDKRRFDPQTPLKRALGEKIGGSLSPQRRLEMAINKSLKEQLINLTRREEVMASEALRTGRVTVQGENYPTKIVDFHRDPALTVALLASAQWKASDDPTPGNGKVFDDLEDWAALIQEKSGAVATDVIMDPKAWKVFKNSSQTEKYLIDLRRGTGINFDADPLAPGQGNKKARYVGRVGDFRFHIYNDAYTDDDGQTKKLLPDYTVIMVDIEQFEGTRCYGLIQDEKAKFKAQRYFTKSWLEEDPAVRWLLMQSAPLVVPYRANASFCATVRVAA